MNLVGKETISLAIELGIGSKDGVKIISDIPFLIIFIKDIYSFLHSIKKGSKFHLNHFNKNLNLSCNK